jgi:hypothetical protein
METLSPLEVHESVKSSVRSLQESVNLSKNSTVNEYIEAEKKSIKSRRRTVKKSRN